MAYSKIIILLLLVAFSFFNCKAQEGNKYVYQDSSVRSMDTISVKIIRSASADSTRMIDSTILVTNVATVPDTILRLNDLVISVDSMNALKNSTAFIYAKDLDSLLKDLRKKQDKINISENGSGWFDSLFDSIITKIFLWTLAVLFILFVLYKLFFTQGIFQKRNNKADVNELNGDEASNNNHDYDKLIIQSMNDSNYRLAVRYSYLQSLQKLADNDLVQLVADKTNHQYINDLNGTIYKEEFSWLTSNYEYVWYGKFELSKDAFLQVQNNFREFNSRLHKN
jgi:hypothetical protein